VQGHQRRILKEIIMSKKEYSVAVPVSGVIYVTVEADSAEEAIELALQSEDISLNNLGEWEAHRHLVQGNVCYASYVEANAEVTYDPEEDQ
jgi:hypothetical protein